MSRTCYNWRRIVVDLYLNRTSGGGGATREGFAPHATTVVGVRRDGRLALGADGQVTLGQGTVVKHTALKLRRLYRGRVLAGFAGGVADAFALFEAFEQRLEGYHGDLQRAAVELCRDWRTDRGLRRLDAVLLVGDRRNLLLLSGSGEVIAPDDGVLAIGSGGPYALAAARALLRHTALPADAVCREALQVASEICVYTNDHIQVESLDGDADEAAADGGTEP
jgi:ATP-dependent HslUV protease subunit HslV